MEICLLTVFLSGCAGMLTPPAEIDAGKVNAVIKTNRGNPDLIILDVRSPREYSEGHIQGALNIPVESASFRGKVDRLDRNKTYILYCRSGNRGSSARAVMLEMGFSRAANMRGGFLEWQRARFRIVKGDE